MEMQQVDRASQETFRVDLNSIREDNRAVALMGYYRPQIVPRPEDRVVAVDEDGAFYDAVVEAVLPDSRVYLRLDWLSKRVVITVPPYDVSTAPRYGLAGNATERVVGG